MQHSYVIYFRCWYNVYLDFNGLRGLPWNSYHNSASFSSASFRRVWLARISVFARTPSKSSAFWEVAIVANAVLRIRIAVLSNSGFLRCRLRSYVHSYIYINSVVFLDIYAWNGDGYFALLVFARLFNIWLSLPIELSSFWELTCIVRILNNSLSVWQCAILWNVHNIRFWLWQNVHCYRHLYRRLTWEGNNNLAILCARIVSIRFIFRLPCKGSSARILIRIVGILNNILSVWQIRALWNVDFRCTWLNNVNLYCHFLRLLPWNCYNNSALRVSSCLGVWLVSFIAVLFLPLKLRVIRELILIGNHVFWLRFNTLWHSHTSFRFWLWSLNNYRHVDHSC